MGALLCASPSVVETPQSRVSLHARSSASDERISALRIVDAPLTPSSPASAYALPRFGGLETRP